MKPPRLSKRLGVPSSLVTYAQGWWGRASSPSHWGTAMRVRRGQRLPKLGMRPTRRGQVWAIAMVRNESDIIDGFVRHVFSQDVDRLLVVDNMSTDDTRSRLEDLSRDYPIYLGVDTERAYFQAHKMSRLAQYAWSRGADWVVPMDADEFWFAGDRPLGQALRRSHAHLLRAQMHNFFPDVDEERLVGPVGRGRFDVDPAPHGKVCFRAFPGAWLHMGNHQVERPGREEQGLRIVHVPWRSYEQFRRKGVEGAAALDAAGIAPHLGGHWRSQAALDEAQLRTRWDRLLRGEHDPDLTWTPGPRARPVDLTGCATWRNVGEAVSLS